MTIGKASNRTLISAISGLLLISLTACSPQAAQPGASAREAAPNRSPDEAENVRLVGYNNMQGRYALQVTTKSNPREGSGHVAAFDISNPAKPTLVWSYDTSPPGRGPHTVSPIVYDTVPGWEGDGLPRKYAFVTDELGEECGKGEKSKSTMFDITHENHPMPVSTFFVPTGDFCKRGRNFGPHQHAETINGELDRFDDKLAWIAYMNAGVRVVDLSDPYDLKEVGHYIPKTNVHTQGARPIQLTDVDIDHRGLAYATDRSAAVCLTTEGGNVSVEGGGSCVGTGLFVFEYTGKKPTPARTTN